MPYPLQFRPNTTCDTFGPFGLPISVGVPLQIMRPMLGLRFNQLFPDTDLVMPPGAVILRFVLQDEPTANLFYGPPNYRKQNSPFMKLVEEPNLDNWIISDALVWADSLGGDPYVAGFASKRIAVEDTAIAGVVPGVAMLDANPPITPGATYSNTLNHGAHHWYKFPLISGQAACAVIRSRTGGGAAFQLKLWIGWPGTPVALMTSGAGAEFVNSLTTFAQGAGPWCWLEIINPDAAVNADYTFSVFHTRQPNLPT